MQDIKIKIKLKQICHERGISLRELSRQSGVDYNSLYHWNNPTAKAIAKIMTALNCTFDDLVEIEVIDL